MKVNILNKSDNLPQTQQDFIDKIIEASVDLIVVYDKETRCILFNAKCEEVFGIKREGVLGKKFLEIFPHLKGSASHNDLLKALDGQHIHNASVKSTITGRNYENHLIPLRENGEVYAVLIMGHDTNDLTTNTAQLKTINLELQQRNEELRRSEERYQRMTNEVEDYAILLLDLEGHIQNWNKGAERIKGYKADEIVGKNFRIFYPRQLQEEKLPERLIAEAVAKGKATHEGWRVRKDSTMFWGSVVITALHNDENKVIGFTKVTRDLTERKLAEDKLRTFADQLEKKNKELEKSNSELKSFSYVASHDLQEPLRKIQAFGNLILETDKDILSKASKDYFARMVKAANRMQNLIDSLLEFSRTSTLIKIFEEVDFNVMLDEVKKELKEMLEESNATIKVSGLRALSVIPFQIKQILSNFITNAVKYAREGVPPVINITGSIVKAADTGHIHAEPGMDYFKLAVQDNGIGFEQVYAGKIFELFQRLHGKNEYSGSGIGLAIVKKIAENHNGFVTAEGRLDEGSTFNLYLPLTR